MKPSVTIVLPVHNVERDLRSTLLRILELTETSRRRICLAVVDDGSTDGTFEAACELARMFPQIQVLRQPCQSGLAMALDLVRRMCRVDEVLAHNGISPVNIEELAELLAKSPAGTGEAPLLGGRGSRRIAALAALRTRSAEPARSSGSFRWMRLDAPATPRRLATPTFRLPLVPETLGESEFRPRFIASPAAAGFSS